SVGWPVCPWIIVSFCPGVFEVLSKQVALDWADFVFLVDWLFWLARGWRGSGAGPATMPAPRWVSLITWSKGFIVLGKWLHCIGQVPVHWGPGVLVPLSLGLLVSGSLESSPRWVRMRGDWVSCSVFRWWGSVFGEAAMGESLSGGGGLGVGPGESPELVLLRVLLAIVSGSEDESSSVCLLTTRVFLLVRGLVRGLGWWGMHCRSCCMSSDGLGRVCFAGGVVPRIY
ncbi:hypothetical protein CBL_20520, partial [Carabus blaptoides fortunei]